MLDSNFLSKLGIINSEHHIFAKMTSTNLPINSNLLQNRLSIIQGDLITQSVDAIVNPTNCDSYLANRNQPSPA